MNKFDFNKWKNIRIQRVDLSKIDDQTLLLNLYFTQLLTLVVAVVLIWIQRRNPLELLVLPEGAGPWLWGAGLAAMVIVFDLLISRWVPEEVVDDGGINEKLFRYRSVWHIVLISFIVAVCEEMLFRGAIQHWLGAYWTSILFALVHVRYLRHWLMTGLVFSISYGMGWVYTQTGSLWTPIAAHFIIDCIMGFIIRFRGNTSHAE